MAARQAVVDAADRLLEGRATILGVSRSDLAEPDWFVDPCTAKTAPRQDYALRVNYRSPEVAANVKHVWELSRHHHLTQLASAWFLTRDDRYARLVAGQLRNWWAQNPFLSGVHWTCGIELAIRLVSWVWIRRLLEDWPQAASLFEDDELAARQLYWHQMYLSAFHSTGSSANNHAVAESAGQLVAACAFPWFPESCAWREQGAQRLEHALESNTFSSGINRELASGYHLFVAELGLTAAVEAEAAGHPVSAGTWDRLCQMVDATAAIVDETMRMPRQGDSDDAHALVLDPVGERPAASLLEVGARLFGSRPWWPSAPEGGDMRSVLLTSLATDRKRVAHRPADRPSYFSDAGLLIMRSAAGDGPEIWCRCDGGPHGHLSIAAHAHADALSVEVRHQGVDILADPGTYCYQGEPRWRAYFRSTIAHNTVEVDGTDQSLSGGPFMWVRQAVTRVLQVEPGAGESPARWHAEHLGYCRLASPLVHRRRVSLESVGRRIDIVDQVESEQRHTLRLAFHLGPLVEIEMQDGVGTLAWPGPGGTRTATMTLPTSLRWSTHRGATDPPLGWYSPGFGTKQPSTTVLGTGVMEPPSYEARTTLVFEDRPQR